MLGGQVRLRVTARTRTDREMREDKGDERGAESDAQRGVVGDLADDLRREGVAEEMNVEEIHRNSSGADGCGDGIDDGGIERTGVEEEEELRRKQRWDNPTAGAEEKQNAEGQRESYAPEAEQVEGAVIGAEPALCDPAANGCAEIPSSTVLAPASWLALATESPTRVVQKFRHPVGDAAHGKGEHRQAEGCGEESGIAEESGEGGPISCGLDVIFCAAHWLPAEDAVEECHDESRNRADEEGLTPSPHRSHLATSHVAESGTDGNRDVEDGEDTIAVALGIEVGDHCRRENAEGGFADADDGVTEVERPVAVDPRGAERGEAPEHGAGDDEGLAAIAIAEPAGERRGQHVDKEHGGGERAHLLAGGVEFILNQGKFAGEYVAVDVVEEVEGDEEDQRGEGWGDARGRG